MSIKQHTTREVITAYQIPFTDRWYDSKSIVQDVVLNTTSKWQRMLRAMKIRKLKPGDNVKDSQRGGSGIVVAVSDDENDMTVLWSIEPWPHPDEYCSGGRYNPLSIEEDIWIPVGCQGGATCSGCLGRGCVGKKP